MVRVMGRCRFVVLTKVVAAAAASRVSECGFWFSVLEVASAEGRR